MMFTNSPIPAACSSAQHGVFEYEHQSGATLLFLQLNMNV